MGVNFSHTSASWSYLGFRDFRDALAAHEGVELAAMDGFRREGDDRPRLSWDTVTTDLKPLLSHSDCDGELSPAECRQVAPRLREVVDAIWAADTAVWASDPAAYRNRTGGLALADGMDAAASSDEPLLFR